MSSSWSRSEGGERDSSRSPRSFSIFGGFEGKTAQSSECDTSMGGTMRGIVGSLSPNRYGGGWPIGFGGLLA